MDGWIDRYTDGCQVSLIDGWMDGWIDIYAAAPSMGDIVATRRWVCYGRWLPGSFDR